MITDKGHFFDFFSDASLYRITEELIAASAARFERFPVYRPRQFNAEFVLINQKPENSMNARKRTPDEIKVVLRFFRHIKLDRGPIQSSLL